jgi:glycosyltransferase involved in cell wall biosynthesis
VAARYDLRNVVVIENAISLPASLPPPPVGSPAALLFIGALGYFPNQEAVRFLLDEVLPRLQGGSPSSAHLLLAGAGAPPRLRIRLRHTPDVTWVRAPRSVEPLYARSAVALAPIRAGGGTRLKVLEAFAQGRPLVATAAAVAGHDVQPGVHYLRAEAADEWATAIRALLEQPALAARLTTAAFDWVQAHSVEKAVDRVSALAAPV